MISCWLRLKRHAWGPWVPTPSNILPRGLVAYIAVCKRCGKHDCRLIGVKS